MHYNPVYLSLYAEVDKVEVISSTTTSQTTRYNTSNDLQYSCLKNPVNCKYSLECRHYMPYAWTVLPSLRWQHTTPASARKVTHITSQRIVIRELSTL